MSDKPTVQDVLRQFYPGYLEKYIPNARQAKAAVHILNCKTGAYGVNVSRCNQCGHIQIHNNSCRDRSCPMCQALSNEPWVDAQNEHVLDIDYYHLVFTCPGELNALIYCNQKELYSLFFNAVAETVMELSRNPAHMGGTPGFISIMHTWGSNLSYHPHVHVLCTGGGLDRDRNWHQKKDGFFLPGRAMAALFKGKFLSGLKALHEAGNLSYEGEAARYRSQYEFQELLDDRIDDRDLTNRELLNKLRESIFKEADKIRDSLGELTYPAFYPCMMPMQETVGQKERKVWQTEKINEVALDFMDRLIGE